MNKQEEILESLTDFFNKMDLLNRPVMAKALKGYNLSEVQCLEYIGKNVDANVTKLADALFLTRGAISKTLKKLEERGLVTRYQRPDNKKEIYFQLTAQGREVELRHQEVHQLFVERDREVFKGMTEAEYQAILNFSTRYNAHLDQILREEHLKK